jgi:hypothetical protein
MMEIVSILYHPGTSPLPQKAWANLHESQSCYINIYDDQHKLASATLFQTKGINVSCGALAWLLVVWYFGLMLEAI